MEKIVSTISQKSKEEVCVSRADPTYSLVVSIFSRKGSLDGPFLIVGPSLDWGVLTPGEIERIYSEYDDCVIPFYQCIFSNLSLLLLFNGFEMEFLKHFMVALS